MSCMLFEYFTVSSPKGELVREGRWDSCPSAMPRHTQAPWALGSSGAVTLTDQDAPMHREVVLRPFRCNTAVYDVATSIHFCR